MIIKDSFRNVEGIMTGQPRSTVMFERETLGDLI